MGPQGAVEDDDIETGFGIGTDGYVSLNETKEE